MQIFLKYGFNPYGWTATVRPGVTRKTSTKRLKHTGNLLRKNLQLEGVG